MAKPNKVVWYGGHVINLARTAALNRLIRAGLELRNYHRRDLASPYPPASEPGEFPARRTGRLRDGIQMEVHATGRMWVRIKSTARNPESQFYYQAWLIQHGRKHIGHSFYRIKRRLKLIIENYRGPGVPMNSRAVGRRK